MDSHKDKDKQERGPMPDDYMPQKTMDYMALDFELLKGFAFLDDEQAGKLLKRMAAYARDYSKSYDQSLSIDIAGFSDMACFLAEMARGQIQRRAEAYRATSYKRSGNGGGRPPHKP